MSTEILFIGDPHFMTSNIPEVELFIDRITDLATSKQPDIIVIGGDLLHTHERLHTLPLNKAYEFVDKMRKIATTYVLVGNHDYIQNQQFLTENHWMNGMKEWENTIIVDKLYVENIKNSSFVFTPYVPPGRFEEALSTLNNDSIWKKSDCIFAHQEFFGCKMGAIISVDGDKWDIDYPEIVSGHIHSKQTPQTNIYYPGSSMQHAFGESTKNIIAYLTFNGDKQKYHLEEIDLNLPRKKIVYMDIQNIDEYKIPETDDKIKISISGVYEDFKTLKKTKKYKELISKGVKVVFKTKNTDSDKTQMDHMDNKSFETILYNIIDNQKDSYLYETYELVINNKQVNNNDIIYI